MIIASKTCKNDTIYNIPRDTDKSIYRTQYPIITSRPETKKEETRTPSVPVPPYIVVLIRAANSTQCNNPVYGTPNTVHIGNIM